MTTRLVLLIKAGVLVMASGLTGSGVGAGAAQTLERPAPARFDARTCPSGYSEGGTADYFSDEGDANPLITLDRLHWLMTHDAQQPVERHVLNGEPDGDGRPTKIAVYVDVTGLTMAEVELVQAARGWQILGMHSCAPVGSARP